MPKTLQGTKRRQINDKMTLLCFGVFFCFFLAGVKRGEDDKVLLSIRMSPRHNEKTKWHNSATILTTVKPYHWEL